MLHFLLFHASALFILKVHVFAKIKQLSNLPEVRRNMSTVSCRK